MDVAKAMARAGAGMEVDATHWTRLAFLVGATIMAMLDVVNRSTMPTVALLPPSLSHWYRQPQNSPT